MPVDLLALNHTSYRWNTPFTTEIDDVGVNPSRNFDVYANIHARKGIETAKGSGVSGHRNGQLKSADQ